MHDLAAPRHQRRGVRQAAGVDIFGGEEGRDAVEPRGVESLGHEIPLVFGLKPYPCFRSCRAKSRHPEGVPARWASRLRSTRTGLVQCAKAEYFSARSGRADRKSTRLNSSPYCAPLMPSYA